MSTITRTLRNLRRIGLKEYCHQMMNIGDTKAGTYIATDRYGNKYYENQDEELPRTPLLPFLFSSLSPLFLSLSLSSLSLSPHFLLLSPLLRYFFLAKKKQEADGVSDIDSQDPLGRLQAEGI